MASKNNDKNAKYDSNNYLDYGLGAAGTIGASTYVISKEFKKDKKLQDAITKYKTIPKKYNVKSIEKQIKTLKDKIAATNKQFNASAATANADDLRVDKYRANKNATQKLQALESKLELAKRHIAINERIKEINTRSNMKRSMNSTSAENNALKETIAKTQQRDLAKLMRNEIAAADELETKHKIAADKAETQRVKDYAQNKVAAYDPDVAKETRQRDLTRSRIDENVEKRRYTSSAQKTKKSLERPKVRVPKTALKTLAASGLTGLAAKAGFGKLADINRRVAQEDRDYALKAGKEAPAYAKYNGYADDREQSADKWDTAEKYAGAASAALGTTVLGKYGMDKAKAMYNIDNASDGMGRYDSTVQLLKDAKGKYLDDPKARAKAKMDKYNTFAEPDTLVREETYKQTMSDLDEASRKRFRDPRMDKFEADNAAIDKEEAERTKQSSAHEGRGGYKESGTKAYIRDRIDARVADVNNQIKARYDAAGIGPTESGYAPTAAEAKQLQKFEADKINLRNTSEFDLHNNADIKKKFDAYGYFKNSPLHNIKKNPTSIFDEAGIAMKNAGIKAGELFDAGKIKLSAGEDLFAGGLAAAEKQAKSGWNKAQQTAQQVKDAGQEFYENTKQTSTGKPDAETKPQSVYERINKRVKKVFNKSETPGVVDSPTKKLSRAAQARADGSKAPFAKYGLTNNAITNNAITRGVGRVGLAQLPSMIMDIAAGVADTEGGQGVSGSDLAMGIYDSARDYTADRFMQADKEGIGSALGTTAYDAATGFGESLVDMLADTGKAAWNVGSVYGGDSSDETEYAPQIDKFSFLNKLGLDKYNPDNYQRTERAMREQVAQEYGLDLGNEADMQEVNNYMKDRYSAPVIENETATNLYKPRPAATEGNAQYDEKPSAPGQQAPGQQAPGYGATNAGIYGSNTPVFIGPDGTMSDTASGTAFERGPDMQIREQQRTQRKAMEAAQARMNSMSMSDRMQMMKMQYDMRNDAATQRQAQYDRTDTNLLNEIKGSMGEDKKAYEQRALMKANLGMASPEQQAVTFAQSQAQEADNQWALPLIGSKTDPYLPAGTPNNTGQYNINPTSIFTDAGGSDNIQRRRAMQNQARANYGFVPEYYK